MDFVGQQETIIEWSILKMESRVVVDVIHLQVTTRASIRSVISGDFRWGHTLATVTDDAMVLELSIRSLYSATMSVTGLSSPLSQSFPPTARIMRHSLRSSGSLSTAPWMSLTWPPRMQTHLVATNFVWSISRITLLPRSTVPWGRGNCLHVSSLAAEDTSATLCRNCWFSARSFWYASSFSFRRLVVVSCCFCNFVVVSERSFTICVRAAKEDVRSWTWVGTSLHLKHDQTPCTNSSLCEIQSLCTHDAHWQQRTISLLSWCPRYKQFSMQYSPQSEAAVCSESSVFWLVCSVSRGVIDLPSRPPPRLEPMSGVGWNGDNVCHTSGINPTGIRG